MFRQRILFGTLLLIGLTGLIVLDQRLPNGLAASWPDAAVGWGLYGCKGIVATAALLVLIIFGTLELHALFVRAGHAPLRLWPVLVNVSLVLIPCIAANGAPGDPQALRSIDSQSTIAILSAGLLGTALLVARRHQVQGAIGAMATTSLMIAYLGLLPQFIIRLRVFSDGGASILLYFLATTKFCDIGAYLTGYAFGRHKLIEWLSPKKTYEGLIGGAAFSMLFAYFASAAAGRFAPDGWGIADALPSGPSALVFGLVMGLAGQAGDLWESLIKRDAGAKDSGSLIPAFGGVLDLLDSPLVAAPFAYWMLIR